MWVALMGKKWEYMSVVTLADKLAGEKVEPLEK